MLDTNAVSDLMYDPAGMVAQRLALSEAQDVCISLVVLAELRFGIAKSGSARLEAQLATVLNGLLVRPWDVPADRVYADIRTRMERMGAVIGGNDLLIAAHAPALDCVLVTDNEREFARVPDLRVENWLRTD